MKIDAQGQYQVMQFTKQLIVFEQVVDIKAL